MMGSMMRRGTFIGFLFVLLGFSVEAQQLTRFAVVDLPKVYSSFFRDSRAVREWEERSARIQADIDRMKAEIQSLQSAQLDAAANGDEARSLRLENEIYRKSEYLKEYFRIKTAELNDQKNKLAQSGTFLDQIYNEIRFIAESEGYSMVLNKENAGILWYSPTVDITEKLINNLLAKAGR
jgi:outer membrane protein